MHPLPNPGPRVSFLRACGSFSKYRAASLGWGKNLLKQGENCFQILWAWVVTGWGGETVWPSDGIVGGQAGRRAIWVL